jgi:hypothetical protein
MNIQPPTITGVYSVEAVLDLQSVRPTLGSFWHFEDGGCNATGLTITPNASTLGGSNVVGCLPTFTGSSGAGVQSVITSYAPGMGGANHARLVATISRSASSPINTALGSNYYLSHLVFTADRAVEAGEFCLGCPDAMTITWSSATLYTVSGDSVPLSGSGLGSNVATVNASGPVRITYIIPTSAPNTGYVTLQVRGTGLAAMGCRLRSAGHPDILGSEDEMDANGTWENFVFFLSGQPLATWDVVVENPNGTAAIFPGAFTTFLGPGPQLTNISPSSGLNTGPVNVHIFGTQIAPGATAWLQGVMENFGFPTIMGSSVSVLPDGTRLDATFDMRGRQSGSWDVWVQNPDFTLGVLRGALTISSTPVFQITSLSPSSGVDTGTVVVQITGTLIDPAATAWMSRNAETIVGQSTSVMGGTLLTTTFDLTGRRAVAWDVTVQNPNGATSNLPYAFTIHPYPHVTSIDPSSAFNTGPVPITIHGTDFQPGILAQLMRGSTVIAGATPTVAPDGHSLTTSFDLSNQTAGLWNVEVHYAGGLGASLPNGFEVRVGPHITAVTPDHAANDGVKSIRIDGQNFQLGATARLHHGGLSDIVGQALTIAADGTSITGSFDLTNANPGSWDVIVTNPDLAEVTATGAFVVQGLGITSVVPSAALNTGAVSLAIIGSGFESGVAAWIVPPAEAPIPGQSFTISANGTQLSGLFDLTGHAGAICDVRVQNPSGATFTKPDAFIIESKTVYPSGLDLSWSACNRAPTPGTGDITFDCGNAAAVVHLFGNFLSPQTISDFFALDAQLDVVTGGATVPPFWHFEAAGCNEPGLSLSVARPTAECPSAQNATLWGSTGASATALITAYAPGFGGANRARMLLTIARASSDPIALSGGQNYFGFDLAFATDQAGICDGCATPAQITWNAATLYGVTGAQIVVSGSATRSNTVTVDGGPGGVTAAELALFEAAWVSDRVEILWRFTDAASLARVAVERAEKEQGPWVAIEGVVGNDGDVTMVSDAGARAGTTYYYRLVAATATGASRVFGPIVVESAGQAPVRATAITLLAPNPTSGALRVGFALARAGTVRLSVMDVQGREVATLADAPYTAGRFETTWNGRIGGNAAPMGIYFVRLSAPGVTVMRRIAVAR